MAEITQQSDEQNSSSNGWVGKFGLIGVLALGVILVYTFDLTRYVSYEYLQQNHQSFQQWVDNQLWLAIAVYVGVYIAIVAMSLPGGFFMTIMGGYLFGIVFGTLLAAASATVGAVIIFIAARNASRDFIKKRAGKIVTRIESGFNKNRLSYMLFLRLVPVFPFFAVNLAMAFFNVPLKLYIATTFFGILPGSAVYASVGNGLGALFETGQEPSGAMIFEPEILIPILALALLSLVPVAYRWYKGRQEKEEPQEET